MKAMSVPFCRQMVVFTAFLMFPSVGRTQLWDVSLWSSFVQENAHLLVQDTFLLQTFNDAAYDTWPYFTSGNTSLFNARTEGIADASAGLSLRLYPGSTFVTQDIAVKNTYPWVLSMIYAVWKVSPGERLSLSVSRPYGTSNVERTLIPPKANFSASFKSQKKDGRPTNANPLPLLPDPTYTCGSSPVRMSLSILHSSGALSGGFYALDSVLVVRNAPKYTLFTGQGDWDDDGRWSHLAATRGRTALINGKVRVNGKVHCRHLFIGSGEVEVADGGNLLVDSLSFCQADGFLLSLSAPVTINEQVAVHTTFHETDKWYFISFPFDVYADGIDPGFRLQDAAFNGNGNYIYLQTYNGEKRALSRQPDGNWEVVPESTAHGSAPVFRKNVGYLIALDKEANRTTLTFRSRKGEIPQQFGFSGTIPVQSAGDEKDQHAGWSLCGNPLPAPLPVRRLKGNTALGGCIYYYNPAGEYQAVSLDSDYALPPFAAFFIKSSAQTDLTLSSEQPTGDYRLLSTSASFTGEKPEPTVEVGDELDGGPASLVEQHTLYLHNMPGPGTAVVLDFFGKVLKMHTFSAGDSSIPLPLATGLYVVDVKAAGYHTRHKYLLAY